MASRKWPSIERLQTINALDGSGVSSSRPRFAHGDGPLLLTDLPQDALDSIRSHPQLSCADYFRLPQASRVFRKRIDDHRCENAKRDAVGAYDRVQAENPQLMTRINGDFVEKLNQTFVNLLKKDDSEGDGIMEDVFGNQRFFNVLQIVGYTNPTKLAAIESFDFRGNYFAGDVMEGLCQVLCMKELRYQNVDVRTNKLFEEDATRLSTAILENIESGPKTIKFFNDISIEFMLNGPNRNRTEFDFSDMRRIGDVGCMVLAGLLTISKKRDRLPQYSTSGPPKIRINLKDNDITHVGLAALIRNVHLSGRMHVSLILTNNLIGPEGEKALADAIRETRLMENLDLLDLRFNPISRSISPMLSEEILNSKIKKFNEIPIKEMRQDERRITELDLSRRHIGVLGGQVLADHLPKMDSIRSINLKTNTLGPEGAKLLAPALRDSASLTSIDLGFNIFEF